MKFSSFLELRGTFRLYSTQYCEFKWKKNKLHTYTVTDVEKVVKSFKRNYFTIKEDRQL